MIIVSLTEPQARMLLLASDDYGQWLSENGRAQELAVLARADEKIRNKIRKELRR